MRSMLHKDPVNRPETGLVSEHIIFERINPGKRVQLLGLQCSFIDVPPVARPVRAIMPKGQT